MLRNVWGIFQNLPIRAAFFGWLIASLIKVPINYYLDGKINFKKAFSSGGMPSSHSAAICAATTTIGMVEGFNSSIFGLAIVISAVVMYDAAGVRRATGKHAVILNSIVSIVSMLSGTEEFTDEKLKELIGHTPYEVILGAWLGIAVGICSTLISMALWR